MGHVHATMSTALRRAGAGASLVRCAPASPRFERASSHSAAAHVMETRDASARRHQGFLRRHRPWQPKIRRSVRARSPTSATATMVLAAATVLIATWAAMPAHADNDDYPEGWKRRESSTEKVTAVLLKGRELLVDGKFRQARTRFKEAETLNPRSVSAWDGLVQTYQAMARAELLAAQGVDADGGDGASADAPVLATSESVASRLMRNAGGSLGHIGHRMRNASAAAGHPTAHSRSGEPAGKQPQWMRYYSKASEYLKKLVMHYRRLLRDEVRGGQYGSTSSKGFDSPTSRRNADGAPTTAQFLAHAEYEMGRHLAAAPDELRTTATEADAGAHLAAAVSNDADRHDARYMLALRRATRGENDRAWAVLRGIDVRKVPLQLASPIDVHMLRAGVCEGMVAPDYDCTIDAYRRAVEEPLPLASDAARAASQTTSGGVQFSPLEQHFREDEVRKARVTEDDIDSGDFDDLKDYDGPGMKVAGVTAEGKVLKTGPILESSAERRRKAKAKARAKRDKLASAKSTPAQPAAAPPTEEEMVQRRNHHRQLQMRAFIGLLRAYVADGDPVSAVQAAREAREAEFDVWEVRDARAVALFEEDKWTKAFKVYTSLFTSLAEARAEAGPRAPLPQWWRHVDQQLSATVAWLRWRRQRGAPGGLAQQARSDSSIDSFRRGGDFTGGWATRELSSESGSPYLHSDRCDIDRRSGLTAAEFLSEYANHNRPVILRDAMSGWAATNGASATWSHDALLKVHGDVIVPHWNGSAVTAPPEFKWVEAATSSLRGFAAAYLGRAAQTATALQAQRGAGQDPPIVFYDGVLRGQEADFSVPSAFVDDRFDGRGPGSDAVGSNSVAPAQHFYVGAAYSGVSFRQDENSWDALAYGRKRWFLFPPFGFIGAATRPMAQWVTQVYGDGEIVDGTEAQVAASKRLRTHAFECVQEAGEVLFVPTEWTRGFLSLEDSVGVEGSLGYNTHLLDAQLRAEGVFAVEPQA